MRRKARILYDDASTHFQTCPLHDDETSLKCSGRIQRRGGACVKKANHPFVLGIMPRCKIHKDQIVQVGRCKALLSCRFQCNRLFAWRAHDFPACPEHRKHYKTCYFFKIPLEIRHEIYRYLLPDKRIPSVHSYSQEARSSGQGAHTATLRVSKMIHDELASLMYGHSVFTVKFLTNFSIEMCNMFGSLLDMQSSALEHNWQLAQTFRDYEKQIMLLEQQNRKPLIKISQSQDNLKGLSASATGSLKQIWAPALGRNYFDMIRSFHLDITVSSYDYLPYSNMPIEESPFHKAAYTRCDNLHRFIGRLLLNSSISRLEFNISLTHRVVTRLEAWKAARILLKPFQRLFGRLETLQILSITFETGRFQTSDLLDPPGTSTAKATKNSVLAEIKSWQQELPKTAPLLQSIQLVDAYWQLEHLLSKIRKYYIYAMTPTGNAHLENLLNKARVAREEDDIKDFKRIWEEATCIWHEFMNTQRKFEENMTRGINALLGPLDD